MNFFCLCFLYQIIALQIVVLLNEAAKLQMKVLSINIKIIKVRHKRYLLKINCNNSEFFVAFCKLWGYYRKRKGCEQNG